MSYKLIFLQANCGGLIRRRFGIRSGSTLFAYVQKWTLGLYWLAASLFFCKKLWRPWSDVASCGVPSGSTLFAYVPNKKWTLGLSWLDTSLYFGKQTVKTLIKRRYLWRLLRVYIIMSKNGLWAKCSVRFWFTLFANVQKSDSRLILLR